MNTAVTQEKKNEMVNFTIDGQSVSVPKGTTVYTAAVQLGIDIPIFCYQDRMPPFGACRVCLVEVEKMPKPQASCCLVATEGMVVRTQSPLAVEGRKQILEFLLINHPLDCPICDRGGECPLQEQTLHFGPGKSRFFEEKRHFVKPIPLGPVLMLDRERCIVCARCTRFGDLMAGDHALEFIDRGYRTEVGTPNGGPADSKFIGNTIMICPVGALTSQVYRFRARPWDNQPANSTCTLCPVGCSFILDSRDGEIMRTRSRENKDVNDIWLCDKGWFGYEFTYHKDRLQTPLVRRNGTLEPCGWEEALSLAADKLNKAKENGLIAGWGGNPLTIEENYLFQKLMRVGLESPHVDHRIGSPIFDTEDEGMLAGMETTLGDCESLSFAIILGSDITENFPVLWLRLRKAINNGAKVFFAGHYAPEIHPYFSNVVLHSPGEELDIIHKYKDELVSLAGQGKKGAFFIGKQYLHSKNRKTILAEIFEWQKSMPETTLNVLDGLENGLGARFAGMHPAFAPGWLPSPAKGLSALQVLQQASRSGWDALWVAGANPAKKYPEKEWKAAREKLKFLIVQELFLTETARDADLVLPAQCFVEKAGSFLNIERRVQKLRPGKSIPENLLSDEDIFRMVGKKIGYDLNYSPRFLEALQENRILRIPQGRELKNDAEQPEAASKEGKLAATFASALFDNGTRMNHNSHVRLLAKEPKVRIHPNEAAKRNIANDCLVALSANGAAIEAKVKLDKHVAEGTLVIPIGFNGLHAQEFGSNLLNGLLVTIAQKRE